MGSRDAQCNTKELPQGDLKDGRAHCYCASCHVMYFKRAHRVETQQNKELMTIALTWCANVFVGCSVTPTFFRQITSFSADSFLYTKRQKNLYVGSFNYFSFYYSRKVILRLILPDLMTYVAKIYQICLSMLC